MEPDLARHTSGDEAFGLKGMGRGWQKQEGGVHPPPPTPGQAHSPLNFWGHDQLVEFEVFVELAQIVEIGDLFPKLVTDKADARELKKKYKPRLGGKREAAGAGGGGGAGGRNNAGVSRIKKM